MMFLKKILFLIMTGLGVLALSKQSYANQMLQYDVFLDGDKIGYHKVTITPGDEQQLVNTEARFNVKFLVFDVYQYQHTANEVWSDGCLQKIQTSTDDNGEQLFVSGQKEKNKFTISTPGDTKSVEGCVKTFAYWDPQLLQATHLLNTQNGEYLPVAIESLDEQSITIGQKQVDTIQYRIKSQKFEIDLWYTPEKEWLALRTTTENGSTLRYEKRERVDR